MSANSAFFLFCIPSVMRLPVLSLRILVSLIYNEVFTDVNKRTDERQVLLCAAPPEEGGAKDKGIHVILCHGGETIVDSLWHERKRLRQVNKLEGLAK